MDSTPFFIEDDKLRRMHFDESENKLIIETRYDTTPVIEQNAAERNASPEFGRYKAAGMSRLTKVASIPEAHIEDLKNRGYDILSSNPDEARRALVYIQQNEPHWLTVPGKPFARQRPKWQ